MQSKDYNVLTNIISYYKAQVKKIEDENSQVEAPYEIISDYNLSNCIDIINKAKTSGKAIIFVNCQYYHSLLNMLAETIDPILTQTSKPVKLHNNFRIIMITDGSSSLPSWIENTCSKISMEIPERIRFKSKRNLEVIGKETFEGSKNHPIEFMKIFYSLSVLHSVLHQKNKMKEWIYDYSINECDLKTCALFLLDYSKKYANLEIPSYRNFINTIMFGPMIVDEFEKETLNNISIPYINDDILLEEYSVSELFFKIPNSKTFEEFISFTDNIPFNLIPKFKLNNEKTKQYSDDNRFECLVTIYFDSMKVFSESKSVPPESVIVGKVNKLIEELPEQIKKEIIPEKMKEIIKKQMDPYTVFLLSEINHYNSLIQMISHGLSNLVKALK